MNKFKVGDTVQYIDGVRPQNYIGIITEIGDGVILVNTIDGLRACRNDNDNDLVVLDEFKTIEIPMPKFKKDEICYTVLKDGKKIRAQISSTPLYSIEEKTYLYKIINGSNCAYVDRYTPEIELMKMGVLEKELFDVADELINDLNEYGNKSFKLDYDTYNCVYFTNRSSKPDEFFYIWNGELYMRNIKSLILTKKQLDLISKLSDMQLNRLESI